MQDGLMGKRAVLSWSALLGASGLQAALLQLHFRAAAELRRGRNRCCRAIRQLAQLGCFFAQPLVQTCAQEVGLARVGLCS